MNRLEAATIRVNEIMNTLFEAGFNINEPMNIDYLELPWNFMYDSGASRLVIWDMGYLDYVIKLPIRPEYERYCIHEVELYHKAVEAGVEAQFGWCEKIGDYDGVPVYAMEYLDCDYDEISDATYTWGYEKYCSEQKIDSSLESSRKQYNSHYWDTYEDSSLLLDWFEDHLIKPVAAAFDRFINECEISDIHPGNIGYRDTEIVLCDYAGWDWQETKWITNICV